MKQVTLFGKVTTAEKLPYFKKEENNYQKFVNINWKNSKGVSKKDFEAQVKKNWNLNYKNDVKKQQDFLQKEAEKSPPANTSNRKAFF